MRILSVSPRQCWPPVTGAKLREYHLAKALGEQAELTHVYFSEAGVACPAASDVPFYRSMLAVPRPRPYTLSKIARGMIGRWPLPVVNYTSAAMLSRLSTVLRDQQFDLVQLDSIHMAGYLPLIQSKTTAPVVFIWHNIESELMRRFSANAASPLHKAYASWTASRLETLEKHIILQAGTGHVVCSDRECQRLRILAPQARIAVIENGVDTAHFSDGSIASAGRNRIIFVGSMNYHANVEAVCSFVRESWPAIRERFPAWRFSIVGSNPTPAVLALAAEAQVEITGTVPDVLPYYREAFAAVVPLRTGGGTRLKILEAMAAGVPVVSTALGAEGLAVTPGEQILIAAKEEDWLGSLSALAAQPDLWSKVACAAREQVKARYDWAALGESLVKTYRGWSGMRSP